MNAKIRNLGAIPFCLLVLAANYSLANDVNTISKSSDVKSEADLLVFKEQDRGSFSPNSSGILTFKDSRKRPSNGKLGYVVGDWQTPVKWNNSLTKKAKYGDNVNIAIMDTAVNCSHPNLGTNSNRTCNAFNRSGTGATWNTLTGWQHGTNAAGVAAGTGGYGLAYKANIVGYAVFDDLGWYLTNSQFIGAVNWLVKKKKVSVINWSFGAEESDGSGRPVPISSVDISALKKAKNKALVVKAGGNGGTDAMYSYIVNNFNNKVLRKQLNNLMYVGALNYNGTSIASFSDKPGNGCLRGKKEKKCVNSNRYKYYWMVAPGYVASTHGSGSGTYATQGTSFAAPIVSGAAAMIKSRWKKLKPHQIRQILFKTATDMGARGVDPVYGWGALNIAKALKPVKGKVGGVKTGKSADIYQRNAQLGDFKNQLTIIDEFGRDFDAVSYTSAYQNRMTPIKWSNELDSEIFLTPQQSENEIGDYQINGMKIGGLSYFNETSNLSSLSFAPRRSAIEQLPNNLLALNYGNQAILFEDEDLKYFLFSPHSGGQSASTTSTIGLEKKLKFRNNTEFKVLTSMVKEKGFHGLSSSDNFGFERQNDSIFIGLNIESKQKYGNFGIGLDHHRSTSSYDNENIEWSKIGVSQLNMAYTTDFLAGELGIKAKSSLMTTGKLNSQIRGAETMSDMFYSKPELAVNYSLLKDNGYVLDFGVSSENDGQAGLHYAFTF